MLRVLLLLIFIFLFPNFLYAVGLGEIKVQSFIGEEFVAEVELIGVDPDDPAINDYYQVSIEPVKDSPYSIIEYVKNMSVNINHEKGMLKLFISHPDRFKRY